MQKVHKTVSTHSRKMCSVPQCTTYCTTSNSLHKFPIRDKKLCKEWKRVLKIGKPITTNMYVCSNHFVSNDYFYFNASTKKKRLKKGVIPSRELPKTSHDHKKCESKEESARSYRARRRHNATDNISLDDFSQDETDGQLDATVPEMDCQKEPIPCTNVMNLCTVVWIDSQSETAEI